MRKAFGHPEHALVFCTEMDASPLAKVRGTAPQIDRHIKDFSLAYADQLSLGLHELVMQTAQYTLLGL